MGEKCSESRGYLRGQKGRKRLRAGEMHVRAFTGESIVLLHTDTHSICSGAADLRLQSIWPAITCRVVDRGSSVRAIKTTLAECRAQICAGAWAHACGGRGNSPEIGVILSRDVLERALVIEGGSCRVESWGPNRAVLCGTQKCPVWHEDAGSPQASSALTRRLPPKCRPSDADRMGLLNLRVFIKE